MRKAIVVAVMGAALGISFAAEAEPESATLFQSLVFCNSSSGGATIVTTAAGAASKAHKKGAYMPMFSEPPPGGVEYNGPPLDAC